MSEAAIDRLIVALDHPDAAAALAQVDQLGAAVARYKVGLELYLAEGERILADLVAREKRVFLDLKLHDIPETVRRAVAVCAAQHIDLLTVHASGGRAMLEAAATQAQKSQQPPKVLAVTVLTSLDETDLRAERNPSSVAELVLARARLAHGAGCSGVVASPSEAALLRQELGPDFFIVTPGIRPTGVAGGDDQKRVATAAAARAAGTSAIVVGRPIRDAADPIAVAQALLAELA